MFALLLELLKASLEKVKIHQIGIPTATGNTQVCDPNLTLRLVQLLLVMNEARRFR
jgi:hypothetical protein